MGMMCWGRVPGGCIKSARSPAFDRGSRLPPLDSGLGRRAQSRSDMPNVDRSSPIVTRFLVSGRGLVDFRLTTVLGIRRVSTAPRSE